MHERKGVQPARIRRAIAHGGRLGLVRDTPERGVACRRGRSSEVDVKIVAEMMTRVSTSFLVSPSQVIDLDDEQVRAVARRFLVPML